MVLDALLLRVIPVFVFAAPFYPMVRLPVVNVLCLFVLNSAMCDWIGQAGLYIDSALLLGPASNPVALHLTHAPACPLPCACPPSLADGPAVQLGCGGHLPLCGLHLCGR